MAIIGVDHVVIRVKDREEAIERYRALGLELSTTNENPAVGKVAIFRLADGFFLELVEPLSPESPIGRALESRGEGVHSIALAVDDLEASIGELETRNADHSGRGASFGLHSSEGHAGRDAANYGAEGELIGLTPYSSAGH